MVTLNHTQRFHFPSFLSDRANSMGPISIYIDVIFAQPHGIGKNNQAGSEQAVR